MSSTRLSHYQFISQSSSRWFLFSSFKVSSPARNFSSIRNFHSTAVWYDIIQFVDRDKGVRTEFRISWDQVDNADEPAATHSGSQRDERPCSGRVHNSALGVRRRVCMGRYTKTCLHRTSTAVSYLFLSVGLSTLIPCIGLSPSAPSRAHRPFPFVNANPACPFKQEERRDTRFKLRTRGARSLETFRSVTGLRFSFCFSVSD